jgi:hypothetical protein
MIQQVGHQQVLSGTVSPAIQQLLNGTVSTKIQQLLHGTVSTTIQQLLKGSLTRDFRLQVLFINQCPPGP